MIIGQACLAGEADVKTELGSQFFHSYVAPIFFLTIFFALFTNLEYVS